MELNKRWVSYILIGLVLGLVLVLMYKLLSSRDSSLEKQAEPLTAPLSLKSDEEEGILHYSDVSPMFPGCDSLSNHIEAQKSCSEEKLLRYLYGKLKYPEYALQHDIQGRVIVTFVVEKDGSISHIQILKDIGGGCGEEAVRVVNSMNELPNRWIPGKNKGEIARVRFNLPVKFQLAEKPQ